MQPVSLSLIQVSLARALKAQVKSNQKAEPTIPALSIQLTHTLPKEKSKLQGDQDALLQ